MQQKPENWNELSAAEKRKIRLEAWVRADGIEFESPEARGKYQQRATLFKDALSLEKTPERVPIAGLGGAFIYRRCGIPQKATMYERWEEAAEAAVKFHRDFDPDSSAMLFLMSGESMELIGQSNLKWPGCGLPDDIQYQYVEQEYMKGSEYEDFLSDPSDYVMRRFLPRMYTGLSGLEKLPHFGSSGIQVGNRFIHSFLDPAVQDALGRLKRAAELTLVPGKIMMAGMNRIRAMGYPNLSTGFGAAPFDVLGDTLRGTRGIMMDLYRRPEKVIAATEKILEIVPIPDVPLGQPPVILMPLHKGDDTHISRKQFEKFYWPTFKQHMLDMIEDGLIPAPFAEGTYDQRLDYLTELPEASVMWFFDRTDMHKAKDVLGGHSCIMGNVPITLIATGTAEQVKGCCKDLIDYCGRGGGYIMCSGTQLDDAKEETVRAMIDFSKEYGIYR